MLTCKKTFSDIPFAHRQHCHDGHCALIHGHNWSFTFTFGCLEVDRNGFVVDFGQLKFIQRWFDQHLDHACVFNRDDPLQEVLVKAAPEAWKVYVVERCSCEGLAQHVLQTVDPLVREHTDGRCFVVAVEVVEDNKNSAAFVSPTALLELGLSTTEASFLR